MTIEIESLVLLIILIAAGLGLKLLWELILLLKRTRESLKAVHQTLDHCQAFLTKASSTLDEIDVVLGDTHEVAQDYRVVKGEVFNLGLKVGEVANHLLSQVLK